MSEHKIVIHTSREGAKLFEEAMKPLLPEDKNFYSRPKLNKEEIRAWWEDETSETYKQWTKLRNENEKKVSISRNNKPKDRK